MGRRLARVVVSDDEEDNETAAAPPTSPDGLPIPSPLIPPTNANPSPTTPFNISEEDQDDFVTVPDDLSTPSPSALSTPSSPAPSTYNTQNANSNSRTTPIDQFLRRLELCIRHEWLEACSDGIAGTMHGYGVDEMVNISAPIKERYQNAPAGPKRCLKLSMTDGVQRVFGIEYRTIKELEVLAPFGFKIVVRNVQVRRGLLMLVPEIISFLGGMVHDLDQARQRLVSEVNKPPRGKRCNILL